MRGAAWLGLPSPAEIRDPAFFVQTNDPDREQRQIDALTHIEARGVGKAAFDGVGSWNVQSSAPNSEKMFAKACAEWADGELVASHIAYRSDILCTDDKLALLESQFLTQQVERGSRQSSGFDSRP